MSTQRIINTGNQILTERPKPHMIDMSTFSMSHDVKLSTEMGYLVPACVLECMPGDEWHIQSEALIRCQALISPVMGRLTYRAEWFFTPNRLLWQNWENFISPINEAMTAPVCPNLPSNSVTPATHDINDFLGLPTGGGALPQFNPMPHAAYQKIFSDWYADQDLYSGGTTTFVPGGWWTPQGYPLVDGNNIANVSGLCGTQPGSAFGGVNQRNYDRDYFTSAKPWTQKGPTVTIPSFTGPLPVTTIPGSGMGITSNSTEAAGSAITTAGTSGPSTVAGINVNGVVGHIVDSGSLNVTQANLTALAGTIAQLRQAEALQKFFEADSRGGTRYIEFLLNHFGVMNGDQRLWRAEYIGSSKQPIVISEVLNTTGTTTAPQGALAGHGLAVNPPGAPMRYKCSDYGYLMCIVSIVPASGYFQGIHRMFNRQFRLDWPFPEFAHLGEQAILNQELYYTYGAAANTQTFGYVPQYAEWRIAYARSSGTFRNSLNFWGIDRSFASLPTLTNEFIQTDVNENNLNRIFATLDQTGHWLIHCFHKIKVRRKLPEYVRPTI
ncbi:major capsid protein VP1 [Microviridae Fen418_41]|uniref:major capsid protein VP1 n=1 Tax=Microviridae Fen418_41 TaxID=1655653 RepID=UPI00063D5974|nr:major capsid protein VP1 [Microviridae Fen418_41]AKI26903.1 major capsid protein VP1 [Microviridae Fen418_41]